MQRNWDKIRQMYEIYIKRTKTMSVKELVKILVKISMSTNKSSKQLEKVILNILAEREAVEYKRMMQNTEEKE